MGPAEARAQFPHLTELVWCMEADNDCQWEWWLVSPTELPRLEADACKLSSSEKETLAAGEEHEQMAISRKHRCARLHTWLDEVFESGEDWEIMSGDE